MRVLLLGVLVTGCALCADAGAQASAAPPAVAAPPVAAAPVPVPYLTLISATNYVAQLRSRKEPVRPEEAATATKLACQGLMQIADDPALLRLIARGAPIGERHDGLNEALRGSLDRFIDDFLRPEIDLLRRAGLSDAAIAQIVKDGYDLGSSATIGKYGDLSAAIEKNLKIFTSEVCRAAEAAKEIAGARNRDALTRLGRGLGAAAVIVVDAAFVSAAPEVGVVAGVSLSWGFNALVDAVGPR